MSRPAVPAAGATAWDGSLTAAIFDVSDRVDGKAPIDHTHTLSQITDAGVFLPGLATAADMAAARAVIGAGTGMSNLVLGNTPGTALAGSTRAVDIGGVDVTALQSKADLVNGQVPIAQLPAIAVTDYLGVAADQTAMLAMTGQRGDFVTRTDTATTWVITGDDPTVLSGWTELPHPAAPTWTSLQGVPSYLSAPSTLGQSLLTVADQAAARTLIDAASSAQGALAASAVQPAGLAGYAKTVDVAAGYQAINTLTVLAPKATGLDQLAALQTAMDSATNLKLTLALNGDHVINGQLAPASGTKIDGSRGTIRQTLGLNPAFRFDGVSHIRFRDVVAYGLTTDWVNSSSVHAATAIYFTNSSDVRIDNCLLTGWAGDGVFAGAGCSDIHVYKTTVVGPGPTYLTDTTMNFGGGIHFDPSCTNWSVALCDISGTAQGIFAGDNQTAVRVVNNYIHDIPSQHGMYIETTNSGVITGNVVRNTGLLGMKVQIGTAAALDPDTVIISGNAFFNLGDAGIILTRPQADTDGNPGTVRRVIISTNAVTNAVADGITINNASGFIVVNNLITNTGRNGISVTDSTDFTLAGGRINGCAWNGAVLTNTQDFTVDGIRVKNPASADNATAEFGIQISTSCSDGTVRHCKVTDANGHMRYAYYVNSSADLTTLDFIDNVGTGATDYGYRGLATAARTFRGNRFAGVSGAMLTPPSNFVTIPDLTVAPTAADVNKVLAVLRANGLIAT